MADEDPRHQAYLRQQPCCAPGRNVRAFPSFRNTLTPGVSSCEGPIVVHHATFGRGKGQRAHDHEAMPLCAKHHFEFHVGLGQFADWTHDQRTEWQRKMVETFRPKNDPAVF